MVSMYAPNTVCTTVEKTWIVSVPEYKGSVLLFMCKIENSISQSQHAKMFFSYVNHPILRI